MGRLLKYLDGSKKPEKVIALQLFCGPGIRGEKNKEKKEARPKSLRTRK
jgi:hypothetical protein